MDDVEEYSADVIALMDVYVDLIRKQNEIIEALKEQVRELEEEISNSPSQMITSPPTPLSVDTCGDKN